MEQLLVRFRGISLRASQTTCSACRSLSTSASRQATANKPRRRHVDPYAAAQARARKAANISRQAELQKAKVDALGDPVLGKPSPFVQSFDSAAAPPAGSERSQNIKRTDTESGSGSRSEPEQLNFSITSSELESALDRSLVWSGQRLRNVREESIDYELDRASNVSEEAFDKVEPDLLNPDPKSASHSTATEALRRITALSNASSKDRLNVNIKRCVSTFGRHNTDNHLPTKPQPSESYLAMQAAHQGGAQPEKTPRAGPDTGSSEVQIAILTARIRTLAQFMDGRGRMDKMNKRNLRVLVHRRQKLLKYLQRKERGGPRFRNVVEVLGLTPGAWEGEISLR
ncbi:hypothetical protein K461DRAFT_261631 [Myriangium duriaei CBS 260.36]|uniref:Ribosomal protein S15 n=1 Tax=Myriangium duriaei CBS 260.36 TaxID=1168546 RepID=A0A9P4IW49_9PEZI|nr:hypothetical protein K461DRAFT_261631 [Myriangium duriaei CBS 260.36]